MSLFSTTTTKWIALTVRVDPSAWTRVTCSSRKSALIHTEKPHVPKLSQNLFYFLFPDCILLIMDKVPFFSLAAITPESNLLSVSLILLSLWSIFVVCIYIALF